MAQRGGSRKLWAVLVIGALAVYLAGVAGEVLLGDLVFADAAVSAEAFAAVGGYLLVVPFLALRRRSGHSN